MFMLLPEEEEEFERAEDRNEKCNHITDRYSDIQCDMMTPFVAGEEKTVTSFSKLIPDILSS